MILKHLLNTFCRSESHIILWTSAPADIRLLRSDRKGHNVAEDVFGALGGNKKTGIRNHNGSPKLHILGMQVSNHMTSRLEQSVPLKVNQTESNVGGLLYRVKAGLHTLSLSGSVLRGGMGELM
jgi:hypothetical protein